MLDRNGVAAPSCSLHITNHRDTDHILASTNNASCACHWLNSDQNRIPTSTNIARSGHTGTIAQLHGYLDRTSQAQAD